MISFACFLYRGENMTGFDAVSTGFDAEHSSRLSARRIQ
jgi:hypothetical protein